LKPRPAEAWGEVTDGLQAGLRLPGGAVVESGQTAELQVVVRNVSREPIRVTYTEQMPGVSASGSNTDGEVALSWFAFINGQIPQPRELTLRPGEELTRWAVPVSHLSPGVEITKPELGITLPAGEYRFVMKPIGGDLMNVSTLGDLVTVDRTTFDRLATGTLRVLLPEPQRIKAPVPKEKASPVVWSEPVKVDWKASRAERLAGVWTSDGKSVLVPSPTLVAEGEKLDFGGVDFRDADTGKVTKKLDYKPNGKLDLMFLPQSLAVSPDGKTVYASGSAFTPGGKAEAARALVTWTKVDKNNLPFVTVFADPTDSPLALSPDGKLLGTFTNGDTLEVQETDTFQVNWRSKLGGGKRGRLTALTFNAPDATMAVGTSSGEWLAIDAKTGRTLHVIAELGQTVRTAAASADGKNLALGGELVSGGQPLVVFAAKEMHKIADAVPEKEAIHGLAFSPDGKHLAAACSDGEVRMFDVEKGKLITSAKEHKEAVFSVAYSPDGKKLLTVGKDAIKVWEVERLVKAK
jgi:WD40 repeat protein